MFDDQVFPYTAEERKEIPLYTGLLRYFPNALAELAKISIKGAKQHGMAGTPYWDRTKPENPLSHLDAAARHLADAESLDSDGTLHVLKMVWRGLAYAQARLEQEGNLAPSPASKWPVTSGKPLSEQTIVDLLGLDIVAPCDVEI